MPIDMLAVSGCPQKPPPAPIKLITHSQAYYIASGPEAAMGDSRALKCTDWAQGNGLIGW